jgi:hypothetical protein
MKKFSNISNVKVSEEPKVEVKQLNEEEMFKSKVMNLMEQLLSVRTYGPIDRYLRAGNIKVAGKEMFLEALMDLLKDKSSKEEKRILESLKSTLSDWEAIDSKIDEVNQKISENKEKDKMIPHRNKLNSLYNNYGTDEEMFMSMVQEACNKITNAESAYLRGLTAEYMANEGRYPKELFTKVSELFKEKSKQLGINE